MTIKVVVSGIGLVTPLGKSREETWRRLLEGKTGIQNYSAQLEARVIDFSLNGARSRMGDFALMATQEAFLHAGFSNEEIAEKNIGCAVSQSKPLVEVGHSLRGPSPSPFRQRTDPPGRTHEGRGIDASLVLASFTGWAAGDVVRKKFKLMGPVTNVVAACATGIASIEVGAHWIRSGQCDVAIVGAAESSLNQFYRTGFEQMGVLAQGDSASAACPFDKKRSGFVMGEGAAVLVIESEESARRRGHAALASIESVALRQSVSDSIRFDVSGMAISRLIQYLTKNKKPDYINAHGTGTQFNDDVESRAIRQTFGTDADAIPVSSTKAATGHLLGAAGAVEAAFSVLALRDQIVPPTLNLTETDATCDLDYVPLTSRSLSLQNTLSLSYGFGGQLGGVLFGKIPC